MATPSASMLANTCAGCHGTNGISVGPASPTIAGKSAEYLKEVMEAYKSGERHATIMDRIAKGYTEEEIALMAEYYAAMPFESAAGKQKFDSSQGRRWRQSCTRKTAASATMKTVPCLMTIPVFWVGNGYPTCNSRWPTTEPAAAI